jgi:hypothetical protein
MQVWYPIHVSIEDHMPAADWGAVKLLIMHCRLLKDTAVYAGRVTGAFDG